MSDLISRSELLKIIEDEEQGLPIDAEKYHVDKNVVDGMKASLSAIKNIVTEQPTAYDVEKVVEELKEWTFNADVNIGDGTLKNNKLIASENAIEIVKRGIVSDDDVNMYKLGYNKAIDDFEKEMIRSYLTEREKEYIRYKAEQLKEGGTDE